MSLFVGRRGVKGVDDGQARESDESREDDAEEIGGVGGRGPRMRRTRRMVGFKGAGVGVKTSCETESWGISPRDLILTSGTGLLSAEVGAAVFVGGKARVGGVAFLARVRSAGITIRKGGCRRVSSSRTGLEDGGVAARGGGEVEHRGRVEDTGADASGGSDTAPV